MRQNRALQLPLRTVVIANRSDLYFYFVFGGFMTKNIVPTITEYDPER